MTNILPPELRELELSRPNVDSPFSEAANFYEFRAPYAPQALAYVRDALQLDNTSRALDLGCGPGTIAIPLSRLVGHVLAIDPSDAMLNQGQIRGAKASRDNIEWLRARRRRQRGAWDFQCCDHGAVLSLDGPGHRSVPSRANDCFGRRAGAHQSRSAATAGKLGDARG
jgi:tRNA/tmRNA/rRNA uracil-C5-methylase (TrmA/RlmC/RlmD family)